MVLGRGSQSLTTGNHDRGEAIGAGWLDRRVGQVRPVCSAPPSELARELDGVHHVEGIPGQQSGDPEARGGGDLHVSVPVPVEVENGEPGASTGL